MKRYRIQYRNFNKSSIQTTIISAGSELQARQKLLESYRGKITIISIVEM